MKDLNKREQVSLLKMILGHWNEKLEDQEASEDDVEIRDRIEQRLMRASNELDAPA